MIYFLGDVHGNFDHVCRTALSDKPAAVVFLGDIQASRPFEKEIAPVLDAGIAVRWIHGNHDSDTKEYWGNLAGLMPFNIDGKVVEIDGMRIAGLGGVFRGEIWYPDRGNPNGTEPHYDNYTQYCRRQAEKRPTRLRNPEGMEASLQRLKSQPGIDAVMVDQIRFGKELTHLSSIFWNVYESLWEQQADILVTHEAPSCHPHGFTAIDELAQAMGVKTVYHGHHHDCRDYSAWKDKLGFATYGVGFCGITDDTGRIVQPGDFDEARRYQQEHLQQEQ